MLQDPTGTGPLATSARVLVVGSGVAALEAVLAIRALAPRRVSVELVSPDRCFAYRPLAVAEPFGLGEVRRLRLDRFASEHDVRLHSDSVVSVDLRGQICRTSGGLALGYDYLVLASGARAVEAVPGALTYRGEQDLERVRDVLFAAADGRAEQLAFVVPPYAAWPLTAYELALMASSRLGSDAPRAQVSLITAEAQALGVLGPAATHAAGRLLRRHGIALHCASIAERVDDGRLWMDGGSLRVDRTVALPHHTGNAPRGIPCDDHGFVEVDGWCRLGGWENAFAVGDVAAGTVKHGGLAAQQAAVAASVIAEGVGSPVPASAYRPMLRGLLLSGERPSYLRGFGTGPSPLREPLWWPPPRLEGPRLSRYLTGDLDLAAPPTAGHVVVDQPLSGGLASGEDTGVTLGAAAPVGSWR